MPYKYIGSATKICGRIIPCDIVRYFFDSGPRKLVVTGDIVILLKYKNKMIESGQEYLEHSIVDEDTGEELALNCFPELDKVAKRNNLFPQEVLNQIKI